ncbi:MAG TPA: hypothetical protein DDY98_05650, partial [Ruminococcaceae bacterium]|nr:hypothetical protein [Oscillospiraceae bacterium]
TYNERITGTKAEHAYYSTVINGYHFICLASEYDHVDAYISDEQLRWFDAEMSSAAKDGLPIFVCCHWPINQTHGLPDTWGFEKDYPPEKGGLGTQSEQVWNILKQYRNVFYITGHIHSGFTNEFDAKIYKYHSIETVDSVHLVNLPSYSNMTVRGRIAFGTGYQMEVYSDKVLFRARSFSAGCWYTLYDYEIALESAPT